MRRILGLLALAKKYGIVSTDNACALALETRACEYRFVRRYQDVIAAAVESAAKLIH